MVELGIGWSAVPFRKSSFSDTNGGHCVEVGARRSSVGIRDSKNPAAGTLALPATAWATFTDRVKSTA
jgi:hypothetical protein